MSHPSHVVTGYDGTKEADAVVRWAADEARRRHLPLTVCHAWSWPYPISHIDYEGVAVIKRMGQLILDKGVGLAERCAPGVQVRGVLMDGPAPSALLHEAHNAEMVVVGSHEHAELPVGSSALQVPARARCPVVVVRGRAKGEGEIVVGVDGSRGADAALAFAFEQAAVHGQRLRAVYGCWEPSAVAESEIALFADAEELKRAAGARLQRAVAPWLTKYPQVEAVTSLVLKDPREALLDAAAEAALLVVGDRGARGVHPLLLGATSLAMLQLAPCSIAVVHAEHRH
ncbi:universal stress protein [Actinomadura hibisca]|uniref:universal stress protein n=1 Tax=Actinomadura hibisca TaxID=68565 RepID=UPI0008346F9C|nr:universal stress protein [Actinomadura hibisca]